MPPLPFRRMPPLRPHAAVRRGLIIRKVDTVDTRVFLAGRISPRIYFKKGRHAGELLWRVSPLHRAHSAEGPPRIVYYGKLDTLDSGKLPGE